MILDCSSYERAVTSVGLIFNISKSALTATLKNTADLSEEELRELIDQKLGQPRNNYEVAWFHGSRAESASHFEIHGILPTSEARKYLEHRLRGLAKGLIKVGKGPYAGCLATKQMLNDQGPFAFLIREAAVTSQFLESPEFISDFASDLLGRNYATLVNRFKEITYPYIVKFVESPKGDELHKALYFLYLVETGNDIADAACKAHAYFNAKGRVITSARIKNIEQIQGGA